MKIYWNNIKYLWDNTEIDNLQSQVQSFQDKLTDYITELTLTSQELKETKQKFELLQEKYDKETKIDPLATYWNNRVEKAEVLYAARDDIAMDVRQFINPGDATLPKLTGDNNDEIAETIRTWVQRKIRYTLSREKEQGEFWSYAWETLHYRNGDCEDGAILMMNMMLNSGIPYWRIRLNAGDVKGGGHAYITYLREKDNKWYVLDWCYWPNLSANYGLPWDKAEKNYFGIWFSWNQKYAFRKNNYELPEDYIAK